MSEMVVWARETADQRLAAQLPRRWRHVQAVASKAEGIAQLLPAAEAEILIAAAWLHDIGYASEIVDTGLHALDGGRWLRGEGQSERLAALVAHHSCASFEADERGLRDVLTSEFVQEQSITADALWYSDMTTGPDGQSMDVAARLAEVEERYGPDHLVTRFWKQARPTLFAAVERVEQLRQPR